MAAALQFLATLGVLALAAAALLGWGTVLQRVARLPRPAPPVTMALGVAVVLAIGGLLNLARIAYAPMLWSVAAGGLVLCVRAGRDLRLPRPDRDLVLGGAGIVLLVGFAIATQLPPTFFNHHDDLEKYFAHPVRMLATGTVFGSPVSAMASETLGGMAFLHGFVLSALSIGYLNGVDAVFGLALLLGLGVAAGWRRLSPLPGGLLVLLLVACIDPQYVNVSALFLGAALITATVLLAADAPEGLPPPLVVGLLYAALTSLKPTLLLFGALHGLFTAVAVGATRRPRDGAAWALRTSLWAGAGLLPWVALHGSHYVTIAAVHAAADPGYVEDALVPAREQLLAAILPYAWVAALGLAAAVPCILALRHGVEPRWRAASLLASALAVIAAPPLLVVVFGSLLSEPVTNTRYAMPYLLAVPAVFALAAALALPGAAPVRHGGAAAALLAVTAMLWPEAASRYAGALEHHTILMYLRPQLAEAPVFRDYFRRALSPDAARAVQALQDRVPPGEPVLAWVSQPFHLDYARNPIVDVDPAGLATYWARVPPGTHHVIWEHHGLAVRGPGHYGSNSTGKRDRVQALRALAFVGWLRQEKQAGEVLYEDAQFAVFRLRPGRVN